MAIRKVTVKGDEILKKKCKPVKEVNEHITEIAKDMIDTMISSDGVGLAAPQIGIMKKMFVARPHLDNPEKIYIMINPEIISEEGTQESTEGCLSVPGYVGVVDRPEEVRLKAIDELGRMNEFVFSGFEATVMSHEYDHLLGILYTDKAREMFTTKDYDEALEKRKNGEDR